MEIAAGGGFPARCLSAHFLSVAPSDDRKLPLFLLSCIQADLSMAEIYPGIVIDNAKDKVANQDTN